MKRRYTMLMRRELWEHRSLWIAPLAVGCLLILTMMFVQNGAGRGYAVDIRPQGPGVGVAEAAAISLIGVGLFLGAVAALVVLTYLLDSLYAERKDRSILFWKSLPVSDAETVLAKLAVALVIVPLGVILLALIVQPLLAAIFYLRFDEMRSVMPWQAVAGWPQGVSRLVLTWIYCVLWYLPVAGYLMLASVVARRLPLVHAALPPLVLWMWEWLFVDSDAIRSFLLDRLFPWARAAEPLLNVRVEGLWMEVFQDPTLWLGVAAGAGMLYIVVRVRRYRDDT